MLSDNSFFESIFLDLFWPPALVKSVCPLQGAIVAVFTQETLSIFQIKKLKAELGVVRSNLTMMSEMMSQLDPVTVKQADMELLEVKTKKRLGFY